MTVLNIILAALSAYVVYMYYFIFFERKENNIQAVCLFGIYFVWQLLSFDALGWLPAWLRLVFSVVLVIVVSVCYHGQTLEKIVFAVIYNAVWMLAELLTGSIFLFSGLSLEKYGILGSFVSKLMLLIIILLLHYFFRHHSVRVLSWKDHALLMLIPAGSMFFTYHMFSLSAKIGNRQEIVISLLAFAAVLVINVLMFFIYIRLSESLEAKQKNSIYQLEINLYHKHMKEKESAMIEFRKSKHDMKHKIMYLHDLMLEKKYDEIDSYIHQLLDFNDVNGFSIAHTDNSLVDALVNYKYETAKRYNIDFRVNLDIPIRFPLANADLCVVLGNALDNAIEANENTGIENPYIDLKMKYKKKNLVIVLENSFDGQLLADNEGRRMTRKTDKENHGIGIASIRKVLQKYHGFMNIETEGKMYKLTIVMYEESD